MTWHPEPIKDDPEGRYMVTDGRWAIGSWYPTESSAQARADVMNKLLVPRPGAED